ncbi:DgyrCDS12527 [Dimorphilus gyrociliatus]|uniref:DgyrCDS12527 n=1 Tax=Dimorphilus gyrociliatus TaxID=2664684 RepID=A0A7I8W6Q8_9ANNE|nr:DgyrCDS12527 [Dimorphilus gyrociliatus]
MRTYIYFDAYLLDTYFDAGGDMNIGLVAIGVIARLLLPTSFTKAAADTATYGIAGQFWHAVGSTIGVFLFAIVVAEIRIKAPGAKTFLQVIKKRFGTPAHITLMIFAVLANVLIMGAVCKEGMGIIGAQSDGLTGYPIAVIVAIVVALITIFGGVGGTFYLAYFSVGLFFILQFILYTNLFYHKLDKNGFSHSGDREKIYNLTNSIRVAENVSKNRECSYLTFITPDAVYVGAVEILTSIALIFVNQSFWQAGISAKPQQGVWSFILGGLCYFPIPFMTGLTFGVHYLASEGKILSTSDIRDGFLGAYSAHKMLNNTGDFIFFVMTMLSVTYICATQILSLSSIICYDFYMTYIASFKSRKTNEDQSMKTRNVIKNEEFTHYDKRCVTVKHVVVLSCSICLLIVSLILNAIEVDLPWMLQFTALITGSCVIPIALSITWHRITGSGVISGVFGGLVIGIAVWLGYAAGEGNSEKGFNFRDDTGHPISMTIGLVTTIISGGIICVAVSLPCGGCDKNLSEEQTWEKTRQLDNPIMPWSVKYAPNIKKAQLGRQNRPHFFTVRRTFKWSEYISYILGVFLTVMAVLVWPAAMLTARVFSFNVFENWLCLGLIWGIIALIFILLVPLLWEILLLCRQAYYNRKWEDDDKKQLQDTEAQSTRTPSDIDADSNKNVPVQTNLNNDNTTLSTKRQSKTEIYKEKTEISEVKQTRTSFIGEVNQGFAAEQTESEIASRTSTLGRESATGTGTKGQRWRTFIHLN